MLCRNLEANAGPPVGHEPKFCQHRFLVNFRRDEPGMPIVVMLVLTVSWPIANTAGQQ